MQKDLNRTTDADRYGLTDVPQGWRGSLSVTASTTSGNTDTTEMMAAGLPRSRS